MQLKSYISVQLVFLFFLQNVHCIINLQNQHILLKIYNLKKFHYFLSKHSKISYYYFFLIGDKFN